MQWQYFSACYSFDHPALHYTTTLHTVPQPQYSVARKERARNLGYSNYKARSTHNYRLKLSGRDSYTACSGHRAERVQMCWLTMVIGLKGLKSVPFSIL